MPEYFYYIPRYYFLIAGFIVFCVMYVRNNRKKFLVSFDQQSVTNRTGKTFYWKDLKSVRYGNSGKPYKKLTNFTLKFNQGVVYTSIYDLDEKKFYDLAHFVKNLPVKQIDLNMNNWKQEMAPNMETSSFVYVNEPSEKSTIIHQIPTPPKTDKTNTQKNNLMFTKEYYDLLVGFCAELRGINAKLSNNRLPKQ